MFSRHPLVTAALAGLSLMLTTAAAQAALAISNQPTQNVSCSAGVCTATAGAAVMNVSDLTGMLASSDVTLMSGSMAKDVKVLSAFSWTSTHRLTLDSWHSIIIYRHVTVAGSGALTLTTNDGGADGVLFFGTYGRVTFWDLNSSLVIEGTAFRLVNSIGTLASAIASNTRCYCALANNYNAKQDGVYGSAAIPTTNFHGILQGLGNTISHLQINATTGPYIYLGLFGRGTGATYANLRLLNVSIYDAAGSRGNAAGALVGSDPSGHIFNVTASGSVGAVSSDSSTYVGGIAGVIGDITDSDSSADAALNGKGYINGGGSVGGLVAAAGTTVRSRASGNVTCDTGSNYECNAGGLVGGTLAYGTVLIKNSAATGTVALTGNGQGAAGGMIGELTPAAQTTAEIVRSKATGDVSGPSETFGMMLGGLIGRGRGSTISQSFSTGHVSGGMTAGGLVGPIDCRNTTIRNSFSTGNVDVGTASGSTAGGLVGARGGDSCQKLTTSYSIGHVAGGTVIGGFIGHIEGTGAPSSDYWDVDTSGTSQGCGDVANCPGVTGLTDAQLKSGLPAGFDPSIWGQNPSINNGYPYLIANPPGP